MKKRMVWKLSPLTTGKRCGRQAMWMESSTTISTWWYRSGQKSSEINYHNDNIDGLSTYWYEDGKKNLNQTTRMANFMALQPIGTVAGKS